MTTHLATVFTQAAAATRIDAKTEHAHDADALTVDLQELLRLHGETSTAVVLMLLSVATLLPMVGVGTVLSFAIFALAWRWARMLETTTLPQPGAACMHWPGFTAKPTAGSGHAGRRSPTNAPARPGPCGLH